MSEGREIGPRGRRRRMRLALGAIVTLMVTAWPGVVNAQDPGACSIAVEGGVVNLIGLEIGKVR